MVTIKALSEELLDDFLYFFDTVAFSDNPDWSGCYCYYNHFDQNDKAWMGRTKEDNRNAAAELIRGGRMKGYLAYDGEKPVGWCNVNDKRNFARLVSNQELWDEKEYKIGSIVCFIIAPEHRGKGIASAILTQICADYSQTGYDHIESYPRKGELTCAQQYHGPLTMYTKAGFISYKEYKGYSIMRKKL